MGQLAKPSTGISGWGSRLKLLCKQEGVTHEKESGLVYRRVTVCFPLF